MFNSRNGCGGIKSWRLLLTEICLKLAYIDSIMQNTDNKLHIRRKTSYSKAQLDQPHRLSKSLGVPRRYLVMVVRYHDNGLQRSELTQPSCAQPASYKHPMLQNSVQQKNDLNTILDRCWLTRIPSYKKNQSSKG